MSQVKVLTGYVTTNHLCRLFHRSVLTILYWRRNEGLPYVVIPGDGRNSIRYVEEEVLNWAREKRKRVFIVERDAETAVA